jgi:hypothetical protein
MKRCLFHSSIVLVSACCVLFQSCFSAKAQTPDSMNSVSLIGGIGNYEYLYSGFNFPIARNNYFETAIGIKPWSFQSEFYAMMYIDAGIPIFDQDHAPLLKLYLQPKIIIWYFNNEWNRFVFLGVGPEARLIYPINSRLHLGGSLGIIYNMQLYYERKTYEEVGYPKELQPSFSLELFYRLK